MYVPCTYCINTVLLISSSPVSCEGLPGFSLIWLRMLRQTCSRCRRREKRLHGLEIPESGRIFANVSANVGEVLRIWLRIWPTLQIWLRMLAALQMWLRMWVNVASPTNVVNFANICDKKSVCGCLAAALSVCVPPGMKKAGNFPAFLSFPLKL